MKVARGYRTGASQDCWTSDGSIMCLKCQIRSCSIWCFPFRVSVLFWSCLLSLFSIPNFWNWNVCCVPLQIGRCIKQFQKSVENMFWGSDFIIKNFPFFLFKAISSFFYYCCGTIFLYTVNICYSHWFNKELTGQWLGRKRLDGICIQKECREERGWVSSELWREER